VTNF